MKRTTIAAVITAAVIGAAGCGSDSDDKAGDPPKTAAATTPAAPAPPTTAAPAATKAAIEGPVAKPDAATTAAYIADLDAIDPAIVDGKTDKAVSRGRDQCASVKATPDDKAKLVELTTKRFTGPANPDGFGPTKSEKILVAVRKHICPQY